MSLFDKKKKVAPKEVLSVGNEQITGIVAAVIAEMENKPVVSKPIESKPKMSSTELATFSAHCADLGDSAILKECTDANMSFGESMNFLMAKVKIGVKEMEDEVIEIKSDFNTFNPSVPSIENHKSSKTGKYSSTIEGIPALATLHKCTAKEAQAILMKTQPELFDNPYLREGAM